MEAILILIGLYVAYKFFKSRSAKKQPLIPIRFEPHPSETKSGSYQDTSHPSMSTVQWYARGESVNVQSYDIPGGLIYVGESLLNSSGYRNDASLINPNLKALPASPWEGAEEMGYWPEYANLSKRCRGAYLQWLASGRSEAEANIGYVFLFFYGLERRLLIDGQKGLVDAVERDDIVSEIQQLMKIYGGNRSFRGYATNLIATEWALYRIGSPIPDYIDFNDRYCSEPFQVILAQCVAAEKPIPAEMALQWFSLHPEFGLRTAARRCAKEFKELFTLRYKQKFGDGIIVSANKTRFKLGYRAASPSLQVQQNLNMGDLPNPFMLTAPLKKLSSLVEECTNDLDSYSRFIGRKENDLNSLAALALLPRELMTQAPATEKFKVYLEQTCRESIGLVSVKTLYETIGTKAPAQFGKNEAESLALLIEGVGFGVAPDVRFHNAKPGLGDTVCIFPHGHGQNFKPSREFYTISTILRLGATVSLSDNDLAEVEDIMLKGLIHDNRELTNIEKTSLFAFLHWILRAPQSTAGLKQQLANVSSVEKTAISRILISIAHADGKIYPREIKQIEKLYTSLGLDKDQVTKDIHMLAIAHEPVTVAHRDLENSFSIPNAPASSVTQKGFQLNEELIRIRIEETNQVKGVLENIFADDSNETEDNTPTLVNNSTANPLHALDNAHQEFFHRIISQETWDRDKLYKICKEMGLMVDGAMETLNEWAFDNVNAPLIEDGEPVYVDVSLAKELVNV